MTQNSLCLEEWLCKQLRRQLQLHELDYGLNLNPAQDPGLSRLHPPLSPSPRPWARALGQPTLSQASAQLQQTSPVLRAVAACVCFISAISELCDTGQLISLSEPSVFYQMA